jgi:IPT/TIG domain
MYPGGPRPTVVITGTGFVAPVTVTVSGSNVTANVVSVTPTELTITATVSTQAKLGARDVTISDPDGTVTCTGCLTITKAPTVTKATPHNVAVGATGTVTITGTGFETGATIRFSGPSTKVRAKASSIVVTATASPPGSPSPPGPRSVPTR